MFGVYLIVPIALDDLSRALCGLLGSFSKTIESHHSSFSFLRQENTRIFLPLAGYNPPFALYHRKN
jgi:hypothetical protein